MEKTKKGLTSFDLKIIGIILMVCDHIHQMFAFAGAPTFLNMLGRVVAVIFIFLSVEGFTHTRSKFKYLRNLYVSFVLMNIGNLIISLMFPLDYTALMNNIFGTLFLSVFIMYGIEKLVDGAKEKQFGKILLGIFMIILPIILSGGMMVMLSSETLLVNPLFSQVFRISMIMVPTLITVEGGILFVIMAVMLYLGRKHRILQMLVILFIAVMSMNINSPDFTIANLFSDNIQWMMVFSIPLLLMYNGEKGKSMKMFFYIFYPAHIYILYILSYVYSNYFM